MSGTIYKPRNTAQVLGKNIPGAMTTHEPTIRATDANERVSGAAGLLAAMNGKGNAKPGWIGKESGLQAQVVAELRAQGYGVLETGKGQVFGAMIGDVKRAMYKAGASDTLVGLVLSIIRSKGNGNDGATPDLLVYGNGIPCLVGLELKRAGGTFKPGQKELRDAGGSFVVRSLEEAWAAVREVAG